MRPMPKYEKSFYAASTMPGFTTLPPTSFMMEQEQLAEWKNRDSDKPTTEMICRRLKEKGVSLDGTIRQACGRLLSAFSSYAIKDYDVDFGSRFRAITLIISLESDYEFSVRTEVDDPEGKVVFSIMRAQIHFYTGMDYLDRFARDVEKFFSSVGITKVNHYGRMEISSVYFTARGL